MTVTGSPSASGEAASHGGKPGTTGDLPAISGHQNALDGLRVVAAFAVLATHVGGETAYAFQGTPASWVVSRGDVGVPIFFTLSGLLLYRPWARAALEGSASPRARPYLWRRGLRILPAYWAVVLIALPTMSAVHVRSAWPWLQYLFLMQNYDIHPWWSGTGAQGLGQMWSLVVEASFYLMLPVIAAILTWFACRGAGNLRGVSGGAKRRPPTPAPRGISGGRPLRQQAVNARARRLLTGIALLGASSYAFTVVAFYPSPQPRLIATLPRLVTWFAPGMALAVVSVWARTESPRDGQVSRFCRTVASSAGACWLIAILAFAIACTPMTGSELIAPPTLWQIEIKTALYSIIAAALVAPAAFQPGQA